MALIGLGLGIGMTVLPAGADTQLLHNTADTGSTKYNFGSTYTCQTCHTKPGQKTSNIKMVLEQISTPTGRRPAVFNKIPNNSYNTYTTNSNSVTGLFGNDQRLTYKEGSRNICEVCHHNTIYHNYSNSKLDGLVEHPEHESNRQDCNQCHKHSLGYRAPTAANCTDCHGVPPTNKDTLVYGNALKALGLNPPLDAGAHNRHRNVEGMECQTCHNNYGHGLRGNRMIEIAFRIDKKTWHGFSGISTVMGGTFTGTIGPPFTNDYKVPAGNPNMTLLRVAGETSCDVYCHGGGGNSIWKVASGRTTTTVSWVQGALPDCSTSQCHGTTKDNPPTPSLPGAHTRHVKDAGMQCFECHDNYTNPHMINGRIKWNLTGQGVNAKYKGFQSHSTSKVLMADPYGKCTNVYCHSNVQNPVNGVGTFTKYTSVTWGGGTSLNCNGCHGGLKSSGASALATGAHTKHIINYSYGCSECHKGAGADGTVMNHVNHNIDVVFDRFSGSYSQMPVNTPELGYGNCSANYCHSDGKGNKKTIFWGAGTQACNTCHGDDKTTGGISTGKHAGHINNTNPLFANGKFACVECHANTVTSNTSLTANLTKHVNKFGDYSGVRSGRYFQNGTCTASYCHSDGKGNPPAVTAYNWKDASVINDCKGCHGNYPGGDFTSAVGEPNYPNTLQDTTYANSHSKHMGGTGLYTCEYCHAQTVNSTGLRPGTLHLNGTKNVAPSAITGKNFTYLGNRTCSNIQCHGGNNSVKWGEQFPLDCTGCHNGTENTIPFKPMSSGRHQVHITSTGQLGKGFRCATCHALTVKPDNTTIADTSVHGNLIKNYTGSRAGSRASYNLTTGVCSNAYCHSDGKGTMQVLNTTNGWKAPKTVQFGCLSCHGNAVTTGGGFASKWGEPNYANLGTSNLWANDHQNHADSLASCAYCHADTVTTTGAIMTNATTHANRRLDVRGGNGKSFDYAGRTCSNISCHGGKGSFSQVWGTAPNVLCIGCHGNNALTLSPISSGRHKAHINNSAALGVNYACAECHAPTINSDDRTFANSALHGNGLLNYSGARAGKVYVKADGNCANTYCHTSGKGDRNVTFTTATGWNTKTVYVNCIGCHGNSPNTAGYTSLAGEPNYDSTGANLPKSNSHKVHVGTAGATSCYYCHADVVAVSGTAVNARHINKLLTYSTSNIVGKTFSRNLANKSCANILCHGTGVQNATWGGTLACNTCHGDGTSITTGRHASHVNNASQIGVNIGCAGCHAQVVNTNTSFSNRTLHANGGLANYSGVMAGKLYDAAQGNCANTYCHSNGKGVIQVFTTTNGWKSGAVYANCNGCHGTTNSSGYPDYPTGAAGSESANSHATHATALAWKGADSCSLCHYDTVTATGRAISASGRHLNKAIGSDVTFHPTNVGASGTVIYSGGRTCSGTSATNCHGTDTPTWGDANSVGCKSCHGSIGSQGAHAVHINTIMSSGTITFYDYTSNQSLGSTYAYACTVCHPMYAAGKHRNGTYGDVDLSSNASGIGNVRKLNIGITSATAGYSKGAGTFTCDLVYCHSDGSSATTPVYRRSPNWYGPSPANKCGMCHDNPPMYATGGSSYNSHYVGSSSMGDNGSGGPYKESGHMIGIHYRNNSKGNNQNGFLGFSSLGSKAHGNKLAATTMTCYICHSGITGSQPNQIDTYAMYSTAGVGSKSSKFRCANCHTASTTTKLQPGVIVNTQLHINGVKDVRFPSTLNDFRTKAQLTTAANALGWNRIGAYKADNSYDTADLSGMQPWNPTNKTCLTACHVNAPNITWGGKLKCNSCHVNQ